jgi:hypothetical protein
MTFFRTQACLKMNLMEDNGGALVQCMTDLDGSF